MPGMIGNEQSPEDASDPITPAAHNESMAMRARESASSVAERIRSPLQPGETTSTTRRMSDTPASSRRRGAWNDYEGGGEAQENLGHEQEGKTMMTSAQEMVAKALGGGSRGAS